MAELAEGDEELVVDGAGVVSDGANELLDAELAGVVQEWAVWGFGGVLDFGAVVDWSVLVGRVLSFLGVGMVELGAQLSDVVVHRQAAGALGVVPGEVDARVEVALFVDGDVVVFAEGVEEMIGVAFAHLLDPEIIYD